MSIGQAVLPLPGFDIRSSVDRHGLYFSDESLVVLGRYWFDPECGCAETGFWVAVSYTLNPFSYWLLFWGVCVLCVLLVFVFRRLLVFWPCSAVVGIPVRAKFGAQSIPMRTVQGSPLLLIRFLGLVWTPALVAARGPFVRRVIIFDCLLFVGFVCCLALFVCLSVGSTTSFNHWRVVLCTRMRRCTFA